MMPDTPEQNLVVVWQDIEHQYQLHDTENRYGSMRMTMFTTKSQPKMKGKAAEIKDLGQVLVPIWKKYFNPKKEMDKKILTVLEGSAHLDAILTDHPSEWVLPPHIADDLLATCLIMFSTQYKLFKHFKALNMPLFGLTGKAHALVHCCLLSRSGLSL
jgi:hypothetical protein